ncbi:diguanylate cyclase with PAS/PAC sensor [Denitrovibrio acetiphilus DSM 12809]|uniref:Diguanylate cyclase with PAS/PAC sensor n=1 Tax=Denitrovibrio acetiphilus (strain DSM 12809 / NBRC 114555 / N2460) TaxID=522772 RepID=D4H5B1_DENA2|nr:diguanylate cyclase [Denitrovibrio acetiphilus]ADD67531.1 diguanylate cyclase with PAS/PAC sensor [Denitrovibrio acetiphilus DSM 12809]
MLKSFIYTKKKYYLLFSGYFLTFGVVIALLTSFINYNIKYTDIEKQLKSRSQSEAALKIDFLTSYVWNIEQELESLLNNQITLNFIHQETADRRNQLQSLFYSVMFSNKDLMQLRFIDAAGMEVIRIDRPDYDGGIKIVEQQDMQDKSGRYYFRQASKLPEKSFWHSNLDLNIEHGTIEVPYKPTYRVAAPLYVGHKFKGIVIANLLMNNILSTLSNSAYFSVYVADVYGDILVSPEPDKSWSRYLPNRPNAEDIFPEHIDVIKKKGDAIRDEFYMFCLEDIFLNNEGVKLILAPKDEVMGQLKKSNILSAILITLIVLLISIPLSWLASYLPSRLQSSLLNAYEKIKEYNKMIDRHISTSKTDIHGRITEVSSKFTEITGFSKSEIVGKTHRILRHPDNPSELFESMWLTISNGDTWQGEIKNVNKTGEEYWVHQTISPEVDKYQTIIGFNSISRDITDKKRIEELSVTDRLTSLYNRHKLDDVLQSEYSRHQRHNTDFCAVLIDIDHFKNVNDTHGHQTGDKVLVKLAELLKANTRESDYIGRWGGEEFLIIAVESNLEGTAFLAEKLRRMVEETDFPIVGKITISLGAAQYKTGETIAHFINRADDALYTAKQTGRNKLVNAE